MERNPLVDKLKGYACFLVLFGHVIMGVRCAGINIPGFFFGLEKFIWSFHVALFLFLSGVVYRITGGWTPKKTRFGFIKYKLINLGVPYVVFSVVYILINSFVGGTNTQSSVWDILNIWKEPIAQYWFLYALFFLFCIWTLLSGFLKNYHITILAVAAGYITSAFGWSTVAVDTVLASALAFGLGTCVDVSKTVKIPSVGKVAVILSHIILGIVFVRLGVIENMCFKELMLIVGIYASILLISFAVKIKPIEAFLGFMNKYSFQIYLLHTIFTAGIRIVLIRIGVEMWIVHVMAGIVCGIVFSVIAAIVSKKLKVPEIVFFPTKAYKQIRK